MTHLRARRKAFGRALVLSLQLLAAHPLRTALSLSGLLVCVASLIVMSAVGEGAERRILERLRSMGTNLLIVIAAPAPHVLGRPRQVPVYTALGPIEARAIMQETTLAVAAAPAVTRSVVVHSEGLNTSTVLTGTTPDGLRIRNIQAGSGRLFDEDDDRGQRRVALVGLTVARNLFRGVDPVGRAIRVGRVPFEVIGVMESLGTDPGGIDQDDQVLIPLTTAMRRVLNIPYVHHILVQASSSADLDRLERDVRGILQARLAPRSGTTAPFIIQNQAVLLRTERGAARALSRLTTGVAGLAALLGGIGIVGVMLMSVKERTREIGLRRALGARRRDIGRQFVVESAILAMLGGITGVAAGLAASATAVLLGPWDLVVSWTPALFAVFGSTLLGLVVGTIPAARAARLEPIAALRAD
ncbi:MAG TPA: ABC transporter permease [Vicinamibacterales bacterium]|jgi:putative ABC transport system permease protein